MFSSDQDFLEKADGLSKKAADAALAQLRKDLRAAQKNNKQSEMGHLVLRMAMVTRGQREYTTTLKYLDEARTIFSAASDEPGLALVYYELALCNREMQRNALALEYAHKATQIFKNKDMKEELAWLLNETSIIYLNLARRQESLANAQKARVLFSELNSQDGLLWNSCHLGSLHGEMGRYEEARTFFEEGLKIARENENDQGIAWSLLWLGRINRELGVFSTADGYLAEARKLFTELGLKDRIGMCLLHEAAIDRIKGACSEALNSNRQAIRYFSPTRHHDGVAWALLQTGQVYRDQGQFMKSWQTFREALNLHMDVANRKGMAWVENELGRTYLELNDLNHARESFLKAAGVAEQLDIVPLKAELGRNMQALLIEEGRLGEAEKIGRESEHNERKILLADLRIEILMERARFALLTGDNDTADARLSDAEVLANANGIGRLLPSIEVFRAEVLARKNHPETALEMFEKAAQLAEKMKQPHVATQALLGVVELRCANGTLRGLNEMLEEVAKSIRVYGWRRLKAKYMAVKALYDYKSEGKIDHRVFDQIKYILETAALATSNLEMLRSHAAFYKKAGFARECQETENEIKNLLKNGPKDLHKVKPRPESLEAFPVSLII